MSFLGSSTFTLSVLYDVMFFSALLVLALVLSIFKPSAKFPDTIQRNTYIADLIVLMVTAVVAIFPTISATLSIEYSPVFFILIGLLSFVVTLCVFLNGRYSVTLFAVLVGCLVPVVSLYARNHMYPTYDFRDEPMYTSGVISAYQHQAVLENLYYYIPVSQFLTVTLGLITETSAGTKEMIVVTSLLVTLLMVWVILRRSGHIEAMPAMMLLVAVPTLSFVTGRTTMSLPYATFVLALFFVFLNKHSRSIMILMIMVMVVGIFSHPISPLIVISILTASAFSPKKIGSLKTKFLLISVVLTLTYWFSTYIEYIMVRSSINAIYAFVQFAEMLIGNEYVSAISGSTISVFNAPGYSVSKFWIFSYSWAIPIAFTSSYLAVVLFSILKFRTVGVGSLSTLLGFPTCVSSIVFLAASYMGYVVGTDSAQYMTPIAYFLAVLTAMVVVSIVIKGRRFLAFVILALVLFVAVLNGSFAPDNAPLEHTDFEVAVKIHPYMLYIQSSDLQCLLHDRDVVFNDFDVQAGPGGLYKPIRQVIYDVIYGKRSLRDYDAIFIVRNSRLCEETMRSQVTENNVVFSSNTHVAVRS